VVAILLLIPLVMTQIGQWHWAPGAFVFAGIMIGGPVLLYETAARKTTSTAYGVGAAIALMASFLTIWMVLVGSITGREEDPVDLCFLVLVLAAAASSFAARLRPDGMARAMLGTAGIQLFLGSMIATAPSTANAPRGVAGVLLVTAIFTGFWLISAASFWKAARSDSNRARP
jgi:hypothetical protein